jgi:hypothetical protein
LGEKTLFPILVARLKAGVVVKSNCPAKLFFSGDKPIINPG